MHRRDSKEERKYYGVKIGKSFSWFWTLPLSKTVGSHFTEYTTYCVSKVSRVRRRKFHFYAIIYATNTSLFLFLTRFSSWNVCKFLIIPMLSYIIVICWADERNSSRLSSLLSCCCLEDFASFPQSLYIEEKEEEGKSDSKENSRNMKQSHQNQFGNSYKDFSALSRAVCLACTTISYHSHS